MTCSGKLNLVFLSILLSFSYSNRLTVIRTIKAYMMNWKKIYLYILFSFAFSWTVALVMQLAHIKYGSIPSIVIVAGLYMPAPALATFIIQKFIYKEGFKKYGWKFDKKAIKWILFTPLIFIALTLFSVIGLL